MIIIRLWLENAREEKGLSKVMLAEMAHLDISAIGKYERGERRPSVDTAKRIALILGVEWTLFFEDDSILDS